MALRDWFGWSKDYRQAGLAMSTNQTGFTSEQRREAAEQQWRTIQPAFEYTMTRGREAQLSNQRHHAQGHGQDRD